MYFYDRFIPNNRQEIFVSVCYETLILSIDLEIGGE